MSSWLKVSYQYEKENDDIKVQNGIMYGEKPSLFRKTKEVRIVFKDDIYNKRDKKRRGK